MGGCQKYGRQKYGRFLGPEYTTAPSIQGTQKGTIVLTTTHISQLRAFGSSGLAMRAQQTRLSRMCSASDHGFPKTPSPGSPLMKLLYPRVFLWALSMGP